MGVFCLSICTGEQNNWMVNGRGSRIKRAFLKMGEIRLFVKVCGNSYYQKGKMNNTDKENFSGS